MKTTLLILLLTLLTLCFALPSMGQRKDTILSDTFWFYQPVEDISKSTVPTTDSVLPLPFPVEGYNFIYRSDSSLYSKGRYILLDNHILAKSDSFYYFYLNGQLRDCGVYTQGKRVGNWNHYNREGKLVYTQNHTTLHRIYFYKDGPVRAEGYMLPKERDDHRLFQFFELTEHIGPWKFYGRDEKCACKGDVEGNGKIGKWTYWSIDRKNKIDRKYTKKATRSEHEFLNMCLWR